MPNRAFVEQEQMAALGIIQPKNQGNTGATPTPDATQAETQMFTMNSNITVAAPVGPRAVGDRLYLVFIQDGVGSRTIAWNAIYRNAVTPAAGAAGTRLSTEFRWDGVSWQAVGGSTVFA